MARGELEAIADKATQLASMLKGKSDEGNPLEAWVQSKITKAKDYINSVSDYMVYNPETK
jgi:ABC-type Fe3+-hydroxamate transport system substrate-binding protein